MLLPGRVLWKRLRMISASETNMTPANNNDHHYYYYCDHTPTGIAMTHNTTQHIHRAPATSTEHQSHPQSTSHIHRASVTSTSWFP